MHFYEPKTAEPRHTIEMKSGKTRSSNGRDARKHGWFPSVSTVMQVATEDNIINYQIEQAIEAAWLHPYTCGADVKKWKQDIRGMSKRHKEKAQDAGTRIHRALENYFNHDYGLEPSREFEADDLDIDIVSGVAGFMWDKFGNLKWETEKTFALDFGGGFGGCVDLHFKGGYEEYVETGINEVAEEYSIARKKCIKKPIVIDFKTQATADVNNFKYYSKYCMQLSAYREGLGLPDAECYIVKVSSTHPGVIGIKKYPDAELKKSFNAFYHLLRYWHIVFGKKEK